MRNSITSRPRQNLQSPAGSLESARWSERPLAVGPLNLLACGLVILSGCQWGQRQSPDSGQGRSHSVGGELRVAQSPFHSLVGGALAAVKETDDGFSGAPAQMMCGLTFVTTQHALADRNCVLLDNGHLIANGVVAQLGEGADSQLVQAPISEVYHLVSQQRVAIAETHEARRRLEASWNREHDALERARSSLQNQWSADQEKRTSQAQDPSLTQQDRQHLEEELWNEIRRARFEAVKEVSPSVVQSDMDAQWKDMAERLLNPESACHANLVLVSFGSLLAKEGQGGKHAAAEWKRLESLPLAEQLTRFGVGLSGSSDPLISAYENFEKRMISEDSVRGKQAAEPEYTEFLLIRKDFGRDAQVNMTLDGTTTAARVVRHEPKATSPSLISLHPATSERPIAQARSRWEASATHGSPVVGLLAPASERRNTVVLEELKGVAVKDSDTANGFELAPVKPCVENIKELIERSKR